MKKRIYLLIILLTVYFLSLPPGRPLLKNNSVHLFHQLIPSASSA